MPTDTHTDIQRALERRVQRDAAGAPVCFPSFREAVKRLSGKKLRLYNGIDATNPHLHIGHSVPLLLLKDLAACGHEAVVLLGDFTSRIGDPTDKLAARVAQTKEQVEQNIATYVQQIEKLLPANSFTVRRNSEWLATLTFDRVADLASHVTVQQMLARDMFQERVGKEKPIFVSEFLYPLMQGYDSVAMDVDGEVGGNDQTFNMLVGRDLLKAYRDKEKLVLPVRLLVDPKTGRKVSKSEGGFIALDDEPGVMFEKVSRSIPDSMVRTVFELCTEVPEDRLADRFRQAQESGNWRAYNLDLAWELVRMYHGDAAADAARGEYGAAAQGKTVRDSEEVVIDEVPGAPMTKILASALRISRSEAKRLIDQGAVTRNGNPVADPLKPADLKDGDVLRVGSHRPFRIRFKQE